MNTIPITVQYHPDYRFEQMVCYAVPRPGEMMSLSNGYWVVKSVTHLPGREVLRIVVIVEKA